MISSIEAPTSRLSNTTETGVRVSRNTHAPLRLPGMLSTAGHCDQSRVAITLLSFHRSLFLARPVLVCGARRRLVQRDATAQRRFAVSLGWWRQYAVCVYQA